MRKAIFLGIALLGCVFSGAAQDRLSMYGGRVVSGNKQKQQGYKFWDEGLITIDDLQPVTLPLEYGPIKPAADLLISIRTGTKRIKKGNLRFYADTTSTAVDLLRSWYNTNADPTWTNRYIQMYENSAELVRREIQNGINQNGGIIGDKWNYYSRLYSGRMSTLETETAYGTDTARVSYYEQLTKFQLDTAVVREPVAYNSGELDWCISLSVGYLADYCPALSESMNPLMSAGSFGMNIFYRRFQFSLTAAFGDRGPLKKDSYYHDSRLNYDWVKGQACDMVLACFGIGYRIIDNDWFAITPIAEICGADLTQDTGQKDASNYAIHSDVAGLRLAAGGEFAFKFSRRADYTGICNHSIILKVMAARTNYAVEGPSNSIQFGISYQFDAWLTK